MSDYPTPDRGLFSASVKWLAFGAILALLVYFFLLPMLVAGKAVDRQAKKFDAETSAQTYDNSRQFQQGINRDIARYCRQWNDAEGSGKKAVAELILSTLDTYEGDLTVENQHCVNEVKGN